MLVQTAGGLFQILEEFSPENESLLVALKSTKLLSVCEKVFSLAIILLSF